MDWYHLFADNDKFFASLGSIALYLQALVFIMTGYFIWRQLREAKHQLQVTVELTKAANAQKLVELTSPFNLQLIQHPEMARLWIKGAKEWDKMDEVDKERYYELLTWWLILHENIFHQHEKGLIDEDMYASWSRDFEHFVATQHLERFKDMWQPFFKPSFLKYLNELIAKHMEKIKT